MSGYRRLCYKLHEAISLLRRSGQAVGQTASSRALARSHLRADLQAVCDRSWGAFSGCVLPSWDVNTSVVSSRVQQTSCQAVCVMNLKNRSSLIAQGLCWLVQRKYTIWQNSVSRLQVSRYIEGCAWVLAHLTVATDQMFLLTGEVVSWQDRVSAVFRKSNLRLFWCHLE